MSPQEPDPKDSPAAPAGARWPDRLRDWWYPPTHVGLNRWQLTYLRLRRRWLKSTVYQRYQNLLDRLYHWQTPKDNQPEEDRFAPGVAQYFSRWQRRLLRWQTAVGLLVVALLLVAGNHYGRPWLRQLRGQHYAAQARAFLVATNYRQAAFRAQSAIRLDPDNPPAVQVMAELTERVGATNALYWRQQLVKLDPCLSNQLALAATALQIERPPFRFAASILDQVAQTNRQQADYQRLAGLLAVRSAQYQDAAQHFSELVDLNPTNQLNQLSLAVIQVQSTNAAISQSARRTLEQMAADPALGCAALRPLTALCFDEKDFGRAEEYSRQVLTNRQAGFADRMMHLNILQAAKSRTLPDFLAATETAATNNPRAMLELVLWMQPNGWAQPAVEWLNQLPPALVRQGRLPVARAELYATLGLWAEQEKYLRQATWPNQEALRFALLARAAANQAKAQDELVAWQNATAVAATAVESLKALAELTQTWRWNQRTEEVLWLAVENYPDQDWARTPLIQMCLRKNDTKGLCRLEKMEYQQKPDDITCGNNYAAYALLVDQDLPQVYQIAAKIHAANPTNALITTTYALALLKQNQPQAAVAAFHSLPPELLEVPIIAVYYGITLAVAGEAAKAAHYLAYAKQARLLPEELQLVKLATTAGVELTKELLPAQPVLRTNLLLAHAPSVAKDTSGLWLQARVTHLRNPDNDESSGKYAWLSLLLDSDLPKAHKLAAQLYAKNPTNMSFACTYALSLLKQDHASTALSLFQPLKAEPLKDPAVAAYYGVVLAAAGETEAAKPFLAAAEGAQLLPEEKTLVALAKTSPPALRQVLVPPQRPE